MRVDKNLLLNIFKERCSIYFYLERSSAASDVYKRQKNNFFLFAGSVLAAFPVVPTADFSAESGAKITHFRIPSKSFGRFFRTNFSENLVAFQNTFHFLIAGAKIRV